MRQRIVIALLLFIGAWPVRAQSDDSVMCHDRKVELDTRIAACTKLLELDQGKESRSQLLASRGEAYIRKKDIPRALADYDEAVKSDPRNADALLHRGGLRWSKLDDQAAFKDFDEAIRLEPTPEHFTARGSLHVSLKEYDAGIADLTQAVTLNPRFADGYKYRAQAYGKTKQYELAIADYDQVLQISPIDRQAMNARTNARDAKGDNLKSMADYGRMLYARLQIHKSYPRQAAVEKVGGSTQLSFSVSREGELVASGVKNSSGSAALDQEALDTLQRAQPFPPMPDDAKPPADYTIRLTFRNPLSHEVP